MTDQFDFLNQTVTDDMMEAPAQGKNRFGKLKVYAFGVRLEKGAEGFSLPNVYEYQSTTLKKFAGKVPDTTSKTIFVGLVLEQKSKEGETFYTYQSYLTFDKGYKGVVKPSLDAVFGSASAATRGEHFAQVVETETEETYTSREGETKHRTAWKVVAKYATEEEMNAARDALFAGSGSASAAAVHPYETLGVPVPEMWETAKNDYFASIPAIVSILNTAKANPAVGVQWKNDPAVKQVEADYGVGPADAAKIMALAPQL